MISVKDILKDLYDAVNGICERCYPSERPNASESRPDSYTVVTLPSIIYDHEISQDGSYGYYNMIGRIEVFVRDRSSASNPRMVDVNTMDAKVKQVMSLFPIKTGTFLFAHPHITLQTSDGSGFHVTHIEGDLTTLV